MYTNISKSLQKIKFKNYLIHGQPALANKLNELAGPLLAPNLKARNGVADNRCFSSQVDVLGDISYHA